MIHQSCTELIEAIGLAHDIGHTPFGHVGERTIQSILKRDDSLGGLIYDNDFKTQLESNDGLFYKEWIKKTSFFKHNVNSVELLIQNNVTYWKILDGVLQHTDVTYDKAALNMIKRLEELGYDELPICMAKNQYSLSDDPSKLGRPENFSINIREIYVNAGAGFIVAITGTVMTMPGLPKKPAAENIDVTKEGVITGLF